MAHKKGLGSSRNGRDSNAQRLGFKRSLVLFLLLLFAAFGAGRWSLDHYLSRKIAPDAYKAQGEVASHAH